MSLKNTNMFLAALIILIFTNCSDDQTGAPQKPDPTPEPEPVVVPAVAPTVCDFQLDETALTDAGWVKSFEENFDNDFSQWNIWNGGAYNNELQHYQAANLELKDGMLNIYSKRETVTGKATPYESSQKTFDFTSGRIESKVFVSSNSQTRKVRMIARIKWPSGIGMWPAFWSYGDPWPTQGEIDILEARGNDPKKYQTNYFYGTTSGVNLVQHAEGVITADADLTTCFHVYELIWEDSKLTSILDGTIVEVKTTGGYIPNLYGKEQKLVLNLAVGGLFFQNLDPTKIEPGTMQVDWVKVFTSN